MDRETYKKHIKSIARKHKAEGDKPGFDQDEFTRNLPADEKLALCILITDAALNVTIKATAKKFGG